MESGEELRPSPTSVTQVSLLGHQVALHLFLNFPGNSNVQLGLRPTGRRSAWLSLTNVY